MPVKSRLWIAAASVAIASVVTVAVAVTRDPAYSVPADEMASSTAGADELALVTGARVFFGHQSVGNNLLEGVPHVYEAQEVPAPPIREISGAELVDTASASPDSGFLAHTRIGENGDPLGKLEDFDRIIRSGVGREVDVAFMKFCYRDIDRDTDVDAVFEQYRSTLADLERDYPDVAFLHLTSPLTREADLEGRMKAAVKRVIGREDVPAADQVARERFNSLMRDEYAGDRLFDIADVESTTPDGRPVSSEYEGEEYFALYAGYSADSTGHLNSAGATVAAAALLDAIARAAGQTP